MSGRLIAVVGPSGVGKDTVIDALCAARPDLWRVRRYITRPADAGGESFYSVDFDEFQQRQAAGEFILSWGAHDLHYGVPLRVRDVLSEPRDAIVNLSRSVLAEAQEAFDVLQVIVLVADPQVLAARLTRRGRETAQAIERRLLRDGAGLPAGLDLREIRNDRPLDQTVSEISALYFPPKA